jgi:hypothetical protein
MRIKNWNEIFCGVSSESVILIFVGLKTPNFNRHGHKSNPDSPEQRRDCKTDQPSAWVL